MNDKEKIRLLKLDIKLFNRQKTYLDIDILRTKEAIKKMIDKGIIKFLKLDIEWFIREKNRFDREILRTEKIIEKIKKGTFSGAFKTYYDYEQ